MVIIGYGDEESTDQAVDKLDGLKPYKIVIIIGIKQNILLK